jgi:hypothetical protein
VPDSADGVMMNPPFNDGARHRASPTPRGLPPMSRARPRRSLFTLRGASSIQWRHDDLALTDR